MAVSRSRPFFLIGWHEAETFDGRERPGPRPKTIQFCRHLLRRHLAQGLEAKSLADIRESQVRHWRLCPDLPISWSAAPWRARE